MARWPRNAECWQYARPLQKLLGIQTTTQNRFVLHYRIGEILTKKGHTEGALSAHYSALEIQERLFPPTDKRVALSHQNIGNLHFKLKQYNEALPHFQRALVIFRSEMGVNPIYAWQLFEKASLCNAIADTLRETLDFDPAFYVLVQCSSMFKAAFAVSEVIRKNKTARC
jgi:tetratricopeptide (TPR) repeat protein